MKTNNEINGIKVLIEMLEHLRDSIAPINDDVFGVWNDKYIGYTRQNHHPLVVAINEIYGYTEV